MLAQCLSLETHDPDTYQKLQNSSPEGLPESLNISSDIEVITSPQDSAKRELPSIDLERPTLYPFSFGKPADVWSQWQLGDDGASTKPVPFALPEEAPDSTLTSKKDKKSAKKGKNLGT